MMSDMMAQNPTSDNYESQEKVARDRSRTSCATVSSRTGTSQSRKSLQSRKKPSEDWDNDKWEEF